MMKLDFLVLPGGGGRGGRGGRDGGEKMTK